MGKMGARPEKERRTLCSLAPERSLGSGDGVEKLTRAEGRQGRDERRGAMLHADTDTTGDREEQAPANAIAICCCKSWVFVQVKPILLVFG